MCASGHGEIQVIIDLALRLEAPYLPARGTHRGHECVGDGNEALDFGGPLRAVGLEECVEVWDVMRELFAGESMDYGFGGEGKEGEEDVGALGILVRVSNQTLGQYLQGQHTTKPVEPARTTEVNCMDMIKGRTLLDNDIEYGSCRAT